MPKVNHGRSETGATLAEYAVLTATLMFISLASIGIVGQRMSERLTGGGSCSTMPDCEGSIIRALRAVAVRE